MFNISQLFFINDCFLWAAQQNHMAGAKKTGLRKATAVPHCPSQKDTSAGKLLPASIGSDS